MSRTRLAPTPTNISTKSEPLIEKNRHVRFAGDRPREQRLAGPGRADHQHAFRNFAAELLEPLRVFQELDDLRDFLLRFLNASNVLEGDLFLSRASIRAFDFPKFMAPLPAIRIC